jgi:hypothetical protein
MLAELTDRTSNAASQRFTHEVRVELLCKVPPPTMFAELTDRDCNVSCRQPDLRRFTHEVRVELLCKVPPPTIAH